MRGSYVEICGRKKLTIFSCACDQTKMMMKMKMMTIPHKQILRAECISFRKTFFSCESKVRAGRICSCEQWQYAICIGSHKSFNIRTYNINTASSAFFPACVLENSRPRLGYTNRNRRSPAAPRRAVLS